MLPNVLSDGALLVKLFPEQDNKTLGSQVTEEDAEAGSKDGYTFYCWFVLPWHGEIKWEEDNPDNHEQHHTDSD